MKNVFFAMFDILGFGKSVIDGGTEDVYRKFSRTILPLIQHSAVSQRKTEERGGQLFSVPDLTTKRVEHSFFSDTVILYTLDDSSDSFFKILMSARELLQTGFIGTKMPYRGAIGYGDFIKDDQNILVGNAIIDAYKGEQSQMWAGCIITEKCSKVIDERGYWADILRLLKIANNTPNCTETDKLGYLITSKTLVDYDVPMQHKSNTAPTQYYSKRMQVIDWTHRVYEGAAEKSFHNANDPHSKMIVENTVKFEKWARENNR